MTLARDIQNMCCEKCGRPFVKPERNGLRFEGTHVFMDGKSVALTMTERELVHFLALSFGKAVHGERIRSRIWASADVLDKSLEMYVCKVRRKLADTDFEIRNERGFGYGLFRRARDVGNCEQNRPTSSHKESASHANQA